METSMCLLVWIFYVFFLYCVCYVFVRVCLYVPCGHLLGKGSLGSRLWYLTMSLSLSHRYPCSGVVLDCIDSWSLHPYLLWSTSELRVRLAPWNWFKPSSKIFYWPFQGGISFVDHLCYLCLVFVMLSRLFIAAVWSLGKGWPHDSCLWCLIVFLSHSHVVSWARCCTWVYRFLIFILVLT